MLRRLALTGRHIGQGQLDGALQVLQVALDCQVDVTGDYGLEDRLVFDVLVPPSAMCGTLKCRGRPVAMQLGGLEQ